MGLMGWWVGSVCLMGWWVGLLGWFLGLVGSAGGLEFGWSWIGGFDLRVVGGWVFGFVLGFVSPLSV